MSKIYRKNPTLTDWQYDLIEENGEVSVVLRNRVDTRTRFYVLTFTMYGHISLHEYINSEAAKSVGLSLGAMNMAIVE